MPKLPEILRDAKVEALLKKHGVTQWRVEWVPLGDIDLELSHQNQARFSPITEDKVKAIMEDLDEGFPVGPVIIRDLHPRKVLAEGNNRTEAYRRMQSSHIAAYVAVMDDRQYDAVAYEANRHIGDRNTEAENIAHAIAMARRGESFEKIQETTTLTRHQTQMHLRLNTLLHRAKGMGVARPLQKLPLTAQDRVGSIKNDKVFDFVVRESVRHKLSAKEIMELSKVARRAGTERDQLETARSFVQRVQTERAAAEKEKRSGGSPRPVRKGFTPVAQFNGGCEKLNGVGGEHLLDATGPTEREKLLKTARATRRHLDDLIEALEGARLQKSA
jgi:hypothetical protein